jgi:hypothetical protein
MATENPPVVDAVVTPGERLIGTSSIPLQPAEKNIAKQKSADAHFKTNLIMTPLQQRCITGSEFSRQ